MNGEPRRFPFGLRHAIDMNATRGSAFGRVSSGRQSREGHPAVCALAYRNAGHKIPEPSIRRQLSLFRKVTGDAVLMEVITRSVIAVALLPRPIRNSTSQS